MRTSLLALFTATTLCLASCQSDRPPGGIAEPVPEWAKEFDAPTWGQFFLKYILANEAVNCVLPGTDKPEYMLDNLDAGRTRLPDAAMRRKMVEFISSPG